MCHETMASQFKLRSQDMFMDSEEFSEDEAVGMGRMQSCPSQLLEHNQT